MTRRRKGPNRAERRRLRVVMTKLMLLGYEFKQMNTEWWAVSTPYDSGAGVFTSLEKGIKSAASHAEAAYGWRTET